MWAGNSARSFSVTVRRLRRCCSTPKGCTNPSRTISSSPSSEKRGAGSLASISPRSGKVSDTSSPVRENSRTTLEPSASGPRAACTRMPSHFHSARKSLGSRPAKSRSSTGWASIGGEKGAGSTASGRSPRPSTQANSSAYGGRSPCHTSSISLAVRPPSSPTAVLARRAETPMRSEPVMSLRSAQRPVSSRRSSHSARCPARSSLAEVASVTTTSLKVRGGRLWPIPDLRGGAGHSSATHSERSPT